MRQNGVSSADFSDTSRSVPRLASHLNGKSDYVKSTLVVPEVIEDGSAASVVTAYLQAKCGAEVLPEGKTASHSENQRVVQVSFAAPPADRDLRPAQMGQWGKHTWCSEDGWMLTWLRFGAPAAHLEAY